MTSNETHYVRLLMGIVPGETHVIHIYIYEAKLFDLIKVF
jgi:hypothetical protein